jgi:phosphoribosylamine-glycine ligase
MMCVARASSIAQARKDVYKDVDAIRCSNLFYRKDIAHIAFE